MRFDSMDEVAMGPGYSPVEMMGGKVQDFIKRWKGKWKAMRPGQKALAIILLGPLAPALLAAAPLAAAAGPVVLAARIKKAGGVKQFIAQWKGKWKSMSKGQRALAVILLGPMAPAILGAVAAGAVALAPGMIPHALVKGVQKAKARRVARQAAEAEAAANVEAEIPDEAAVSEEIPPAETVDSNIPVSARTEAGRAEAEPEGEPGEEGTEATEEAPKKSAAPLLAIGALAALPFIL